MIFSLSLYPFTKGAFRDLTPPILLIRILISKYTFAKTVFSHEWYKQTSAAKDSSFKGNVTSAQSLSL